VVSSAEGGQPNVHGALVQFQSSPPPPRELLVRFLYMGTRLSLAASSGCRLSQVVCMLNFEPRKTWAQISRINPSSDLFFDFVPTSEIMPIFFDFQSWICMPVSASDESELHLYIPEIWTWQSSSANHPSSSLFSISFLNIWSLLFPCPPPLFSMHFLPSLLASSLSLIISGVSAAPHESHLGKRCTNSASDRSCWGDYDLSTDYYNTVPDTGVTREVIFPYFLHENILTVSSTTSNLSTQQLHPMESREMSCLSMEHFLALLSSPTGETLLVSISTPFFSWSY
jgi:hypothetical protein